MCFLPSFFKHQHGRFIFPALRSCSSHLPFSLRHASWLSSTPAGPAQVGFWGKPLAVSGSPHSPVDPVPGGETLAVPLYEISILLRAVERAPVGEQPVQGRLAGRGGMLLGDHSDSRGRDSQHPTGEAQCQQGCPWGCCRPKPSKPNATLPPHASPGRLVSSFSRHTLPLCAAPPGLLDLEKHKRTCQSNTLILSHGPASIKHHWAGPILEILSLSNIFI